MYYTAKIKKGVDGQTCRWLSKCIMGQLCRHVENASPKTVPQCPLKLSRSGLPLAYHADVLRGSSRVPAPRTSFVGQEHVTSPQERLCRRLVSHATSKWRILLSGADPILQIRAWGWGWFGDAYPELRRWLRSKNTGAPSPDCGFWKLVSLTAFQSLFFLSVTFDITLRR